MDNDSGDDETDELKQLGWEEWKKEWSGLGWRNEVGSLFQRCITKWAAVIFKEEDEDFRERVTEEEEIVKIKGESIEIKFRR